jgi:hypothetical protein
MTITPTDIRALKGAPLSVIVLLMAQAQPVSVSYICSMTGYSYKPVEDALLYLQTMNKVSRVGRYGWQIAEAIQPPLPATPDDVIDLSPEVEEITEETELPGVGIFPSPLKKVKLRDTPNSDNLLNLRGRDLQNFQVMQNLGFFGQAAQEVAKLPHVTERMIRYHCATAPNKNLALFRIKKGWRVPDDWRGEGDPPPDESKKYRDSLARFGVPMETEE